LLLELVKRGYRDDLGNRKLNLVVLLKQICDLLLFLNLFARLSVGRLIAEVGGWTRLLFTEGVGAAVLHEVALRVNGLLRSKVGHQDFKFIESNGTGEFLFAEHAHKAFNLDVSQLVNSNLLAPREEVVLSHDFHVGLSFKFFQYVDHVIATESLPYSEV